MVKYTVKFVHKNSRVIEGMTIRCISAVIMRTVENIVIKDIIPIKLKITVNFLFFNAMTACNNNETKINKAIKEDAINP